MLFISATKRDVTTILINSCIFYKVAELRKNYCDLHKVGVHTILGYLFENGRPFPEYYPIVHKLSDVGASLRCL